MSDLPLWNLDQAYKGFDAPEYREDKKRLDKDIRDFLNHLEDGDTIKTDPETWLLEAVVKFDKLGDLYEHLFSYVYCRYSTDTKNSTAVKEIGSLEEAGLPLKDGEIKFKNRLAELRSELPGLFAKNPELKKFEFSLNEKLFFQEKQMTEAEENLAADLSRSGGDAWGRMQQSLSSTAEEIWDEATGEKKTVIELRSMAFDEDRKVREKAFNLELDAWKKIETPMAYALNGVKGFTVSLNKRRNYESTLEKSVIQARITRKTLDALILAMEESLPSFRKYFTAKAGLLGEKKLAFFDLFAPVGGSSEKWSYKEAENFILEQFGGFSDDLKEFAAESFKNNWIDAKPRAGKVGGAYCIGLPLAGESRILCNFDGSFSSVSTLAHELGHGYHHHILKDSTHADREYPMTLAETASIFAENIIFNGRLASAKEEEKLGILEAYLQDSSQVIVDILSRFYFEKEVLAGREKGELSAEEFCTLMTDAQKATYGEALDENSLHPYMWAVKGHYYSQDLAFYNFPYAFGMLFGLGLYALYLEKGPSFAEQYREILAETGRANAVEITAKAGFDIEQPDFWRRGLATVAEKIDEFAALAAGQA